MLIQRGLFEKQANEIMAAVKMAPESEAMRGRWQEPGSGYHTAVIVGICVTVCAQAVKWIDRHEPEHWARPVFLYEST